MRILTIGLITYSYLRCDIANAMDHGREAVDIATAIAANHINDAERLLDLLRNGNLTDQQLRNVNTIINRALNVQSPATEYAVNQLELQNAGNIPQETFNLRGFLITIGILASATLTIFLIIRYWDDIRDFLFTNAEHVTPIAGSILRVVTLARYDLVRQNPEVVQEILRSLIKE